MLSVHYLTKLIMFLSVLLVVMGSTILVCRGDPDQLYYEECKNEFKCGNITAHFPFWGNGEQAAVSRQRPEYCGHPQLQLFCQQDKASINFSGFRYRVLDIKPQDRILKIIAMDDDMDALCRKEPEYTNNIVPPPVLSIVRKSDYSAITVVRGCDRNSSPSATMAPPPKGFLGRLNCSGVSSTDFVIIGNVLETEWRRNYCSSISASHTATVAVPAGSYDSTLIMRRWSDYFDMNKLRSSLSQTNIILEVRWNVDEKDECLNKCKKTEGACGLISPTPTPTGVGVGGGGGLICYCLLPPPLLPPNNNMSSSSWPPTPTTSCDPSITDPPPTTHTGRSKLANAPPLAPGFGSRIKVVIAASASLIGVILPITMIVLLRKNSLSVTTCINQENATNEDNVETFLVNYGSLAPKRYNYSDIKKMTRSFRYTVGKGGYGTVYRGDLLNGSVVAVKILDETNGNGEEFINEVASIARTYHVNIVSLVGFCYQGKKRALVYEFMPNGSLDNFISTKGVSPKRLGWGTLYEIALGIARGLEYLHRGCNTRILHFDIKPQNILLDRDFCPKISDFGLAKLCKRGESIISMTGARGTIGYIAPEVFYRGYGGVSHKSDVYSYGMLVLEMVGGRAKTDETTASNASEAIFPDWIYKDLERGNVGVPHEDITEEQEEKVRKMILVSLWCVQIIPSDRPSMSKVVEMLEGSVHSLQVPPKPLLFSPTMHALDSSTTSTVQEL